MKDKKKKLTAKMERFCNEYIIDLNAAGAARRAKYSPKTAAVIGRENLLKPNIIVRIRELQKSTVDSLEMDAKRVISELNKIAYSNSQDYFDKDGYLKGIHELTRDQAAALSSFEMEELYMGQGQGTPKLHIGDLKKMKLWDKLKSLDMLGRHFSLFDTPEGGRDGDQEEPDERFL